jgi:GTP-binding protein EngB required for normal cell division
MNGPRSRPTLATCGRWVRKLETGRVEIVLFGEIDVGKSALINALVGQAVAEVDVRGGWRRSRGGLPRARCWECG